jgi:hypothetical protein
MFLGGLSRIVEMVFFTSLVVDMHPLDCREK